MKLSVIITTINRNTKLRDCINSILQNTWKDFEIILIDQNKSRVFTSHNDPRFKHIHTGLIGKSNALNLGITKSTGDILVFTDDDCVTSKHWLETIAVSFIKNTQIDAMFGRSLPFNKRSHKGMVCPCTFTKTKSEIITKPRFHYTYIVFGNNMAFRKSTIYQIGLFKTWLGPGSIGAAAEDAELSIRYLIQKHLILYTPKALVYHNRWLNEAELKTQNLSYACGEMACYGYYALSGWTFAKDVIHNDWIDSAYDLKRIAGDVIKRNEINVHEWIYSITKIVTRVKGFGIGLYYYLKEVEF